LGGSTSIPGRGDKSRGFGPKKGSHGIIVDLRVGKNLNDHLTPLPFLLMVFLLKNFLFCTGWALVKGGVPQSG
jgi:hypothetical protein